MALGLLRAVMLVRVPGMIVLLFFLSEFVFRAHVTRDTEADTPLAYYVCRYDGVSR
jgi:hypothetical protein